MKVLFLSFHLPLAEEPGAFRPWMEARLLRDLGVEVVVLTSSIQYMTGQDLRKGEHGWCTEEVRDGIRILRVWGMRGYRRSVLRRLMHYGVYALLALGAGLWRVGRYDAVFMGTDPIFVTPVGRFLALVKHAKLLLDERDLYPETAIALGVLRPGLMTRGFSLWQRRIRGAASRMLAATPGIRCRLMNTGVYESRVRVLYNADVFLQVIQPDTTEIAKMRERYAPRGTRFLVVYAGGLGRANDVDTLLDAARLLRDQEDIGFVVAGDGERREHYAARIRCERLRVGLPGPLPRFEARRLIAAAAAAAHMYPHEPLFAGALASKTLDYLSLGVPVVFAGSGDTVAVLHDSGGGMAVEPGDAAGLAKAIQTLHNDPAMCLEMGVAGRQWIDKNANKESAMSTMRWLLGDLCPIQRVVVGNIFSEIRSYE